MTDAMGDVVAGALFQQLRLGVISNNLANINSVGFKKDQVLFDPFGSSPLTEQQAMAASSALDMEKYAANIPARTYTDFEQGLLVSTGNKLDTAINGTGFFCIETVDGNQYSRKGNFVLNDLNELCTIDGLPVLGEGGRIIIGSNDFKIDEKGNIFVQENRIDTLKIVDFEPGSLIKKGENLYLPINEAVQEIDASDFTVHQGFVEQSNVNAVKMMTEMIDTLRGYETYQKVIGTLNEMSLLAINSVGEVP